jgi:CRP-like cAMP-binding protein
MPSARTPETIDAHQLEYSSNTNMSPALSASDAQELRRLIPLNTLPDSRFEQLCSQIRIEEAPRGSILFRQGETKNEFVYLLSGTISLQAGGVEMDSISGGTDTARFALAHQIPRKVSAVANDSVRYIRIEPEMVNGQENPSSELPTYKVSDIPEEPTRDWMTALLKSPLFQRLSPANIQALLRNLEEIEVKAGDVICRQGDPGDFYYIIKKGRCSLSRKPSRLAKEIKLATLKISDTFGEDSLISGDPRNVTVTMVTDGRLLKLDKASFIKLLKDPVISHVDLETAQRMANQDAVWLDVRAPDAYEQGRFPGSLNIPFFSLRVMLPTLNRQSKYLLVCEDGRLSEAAAFLLIRYGFEAHVLAGGMSNVPREYLVIEATKWPVSHSLTAAADSTPQSEQSDLSTLQIAADVTEHLTRQEALSPAPDDATDDDAGQPEESDETQYAFDIPVPGEPMLRESESINPQTPTGHATTRDALVSVEQQEDRGGTEPVRPAASENQDPEHELPALRHRLQELEATVQEGLVRERDLAQRLTASETAAAEAVSRADALEKQLTKTGDIVASVAAITEKRQQAEEQLQKAKEEIDSLKSEMERLRELASDRETALRSLQGNYEHLLSEQTKNADAKNDKDGEARSASKQEIERLKNLNRQAIRDKAAAERRVEELTRQIAELRAADRPTGQGATAEENARRQHADELMEMQARLRDMEEERNQLRAALQSAQTRLAVIENAASATQSADDGEKKKLHFEFAVTFPITLVITLFLIVLVLGGLFGTASGRKFLGRFSQVSLEHAPAKPVLSTPSQGS